jgi:hypothetical protein
MKNLADHILDIVQNSLRAGANLIEIIVEENKTDDFCRVQITDNGCGMNEQELKKAANPFFTSRKTRKVGLGLSLLKQNAERANGSFSLKSVEGEGTVVEARFQLSNFDKPPLGEIWDMFYLNLIAFEKVQFVYEHQTNKGKFRITSSEIRDALDNILIKNAEIREAITGLIKDKITELK